MIRCSWLPSFISFFAITFPFHLLLESFHLHLSFHLLINTTAPLLIFSLDPYFWGVFEIKDRIMKILPCSLMIWNLIVAACSATDLFSENQDLSSENNLFSEGNSAETIHGLDLQTSNTIDSLNTGDSKWFLDDGNIDLDSLVGPDSSLFLTDNGGLSSFKGSDLNSSPDTLNWDLQSEPGSGSSLSDVDLTSLVSLTDPTSLLQDSIWDDINSPLADNYSGCELSLADDNLFSGKRRRATQCEKPDQKDPDSKKKDIGPDPSVPGPVPWADRNKPLNYAFSENFELCSKRIFKNANFPVCKEQVPPPDQIFSIPGSYWSHLYDVSPSMSVHDLKHSPRVWTQLLIKQQSCAIFGTVDLPHWSSGLVLPINSTARM